MSMFDHQKKIKTIDEAIDKSNDILQRFTRGGKKRNRKTRKSKH